MLFVIPAVIVVLAIAAAFRVGRALNDSRIMQDAAGHMPQGAAHEVA